jgi:hypothetical protein
VSTLPYLPKCHVDALASYALTMAPTNSNPYITFHGTYLALQSTIQALLSALSRPPSLITQISQARKAVERNYSSMSRSARWPLGLLDETRQRMNDEKEEKARRSQEEVDNLSRELRYTQQVVAGELAGWQDLHEKMGKRAIREFARGMVVQERMRLEGMLRGLRRLREGNGSEGAAKTASAATSRSILTTLTQSSETSNGTTAQQTAGEGSGVKPDMDVDGDVMVVVVANSSAGPFRESATSA